MDIDELLEDLEKQTENISDENHNLWDNGSTS